MIELKDLTKKFGDFTAVDHLNMTINTGEFFGFLGPIGAGKTTTISMLSTVLLPTEGQVLIDGVPLTRKASGVKRKISVITQEYSMRQDMTMDEVMEYQGRLYYMTKKEIRRKSDELLEFVGLDQYRHRVVRHLSGGMKRKLMVCRALMTEPEIFVDKLRNFAMKYYPDEDTAEEEIRADINAVQLIAVSVEHMTGKTIQEK